MIHGGLNINLKMNDNLGYNQCCLAAGEPLTFVENDRVDWTGSKLSALRETNDAGAWLPGCWQCEKLEKTGAKSFRKAMIEKFGIHKNLSGPQRIDLLFDRSCNLACRTCGPSSSTFWEKHLKDHDAFKIRTRQSNNGPRIKSILENLDLSNVGMVQFCGGETLLGNTYWQTAELLATLIPDVKNKVELGFQTNCTQSIDPQWFETIEKFKLVKLMVSIDGVGDRFEYLRWPASWNQVVDNLFELREQLPSNVMFFVQETTSCLNLYYYNEVGQWVKKYFNANREGDPIDFSTQLAIHPYLNIKNITQEYLDAIGDNPLRDAIAKDWQESPQTIKQFLLATEKFDRFRSQDWKKIFPEVAEFYRRYL